MARMRRGSLGDAICHVLNRGNSRRQIFFSTEDYRNFLLLMRQAQIRYTLRVLGYCLMPNHWHLLVWPNSVQELSQYMHWLSFNHTQRWHRLNGTVGTGHLYQGRFKSFPVQSDQHLVAACRYVERNALRAKLVARAEDWQWGSLHQSLHPTKSGHEIPLLTDFPVDRPTPWIEYVNFEEDPRCLEQLRLSTRRGRPFGAEQWVADTARKLGIDQSLVSVGRPRKKGA
jgi:putative transposase